MERETIQPLHQTTVHKATACRLVELGCLHVIHQITASIYPPEPGQAQPVNASGHRIQRQRHGITCYGARTVIVHNNQGSKGYGWSEF